MIQSEKFTRQRNAFSFTFLFAVLFAVNNLSAQTVKLSADQVHSNLGFSVSLAGGLTRITGKYNDFDITVTYVDSDMTKSSIDAAIKAASISTGAPGRDEHLATPDFFDAAKFPLITFSSDSIRKNETGFVAFGSFQMHGISKKIKLPFSVVGKDAEGSVGFTSRYTVKRSDYRIGKDSDKPSPDSYLSDDIQVEIDFLAKKPKNPAK